MKEKEMSIIADLIVKVTMNIKDEDGNLDKDLIDEVKVRYYRSAKIILCM